MYGNSLKVKKKEKWKNTIVRFLDNECIISLEGKVWYVKDI